MPWLWCGVDCWAALRCCLPSTLMLGNVCHAISVDPSYRGSYTNYCKPQSWVVYWGSDCYFVLKPCSWDTSSGRRVGGCSIHWQTCILDYRHSLCHTLGWESGVMPPFSWVPPLFLSEYLDIYCIYLPTVSITTTGHQCNAILVVVFALSSRVGFNGQYRYEYIAYFRGQWWLWKDGNIA